MIIGNFDIKNPLEVIQCIIAFGSRDWFANKRDRMLYPEIFTDMKYLSLFSGIGMPEIALNLLYEEVNGVQ